MIRRAGALDFEAAMVAVSEVHGRAPVDPGALRLFLEDPRNVLLLAYDGERVVGSLNGYALRYPHRAEAQWLLYEIDVREESRRRGTGAGLVKEFIALARADGAHEVWVVTNADNVAAMNMYLGAGMCRPNQDDAMLCIDLKLSTTPAAIVTG